ncbi:MAG: hypothetical protein Q8P84_05885 [Deltaproteobacteria bacterium]|nr:hypothetical protein [Deltaproteobacteria bacterium]
MDARLESPPMVGSSFATSFFLAPISCSALPVGLAVEDADLAPDDPPDAYTLTEEGGIEHDLTVFASARIPSAEMWKAFADLAVASGQHGPYKFVMVKGAGLFVGLAYRELFDGEREENFHTGIAQGAVTEMVIAAGYFMVGPLGELVVTPIPSSRYPGSKTGEGFKDGLEAYFGGEVEILPLEKVSSLVKEEFEQGLMAAAQFKPRIH